VLDVDGVLTDGRVTVMPDGQLLRNLSSKDSFAIQYAVKKGLQLAVITGGNSMAIAEVLHRLGIAHVYLESKNKLQVLESFCTSMKLSKGEILYMGDDLPDYEVMCAVGVACCPADACVEVRNIAHYISHKNGGDGCVRDIIEQTLRVQGKWFDRTALEW